MITILITLIVILILLKCFTKLDSDSIFAVGGLITTTLYLLINLAVNIIDPPYIKETVTLEIVAGDRGFIREDGEQIEKCEIKDPQKSDSCSYVVIKKYTAEEKNNDIWNPANVPDDIIEEEIYYLNEEDIKFYNKK